MSRVSRIRLEDLPEPADPATGSRRVQWVRLDRHRHARRREPVLWEAMVARLYASIAFAALVYRRFISSLERIRLARLR